MIPIDCKITNFFILACLFTFFGNNYSIGELTSATSKERMITNIIFAVPHSLSNENFICQ